MQTFLRKKGVDGSASWSMVTVRVNACPFNESLDKDQQEETSRFFTLPFGSDCCGENLTLVYSLRGGFYY